MKDDKELMQCILDKIGDFLMENTKGEFGEKPVAMEVDIAKPMHAVEGRDEKGGVKEDFLRDLADEQDGPDGDYETEDDEEKEGKSFEKFFGRK